MDFGVPQSAEMLNSNPSKKTSISGGGLTIAIEVRIFEA